MPGPMRSIRRRLIAGSLLIVGLPLLVFVLVASSVLWRFYRQQLGADVTAQARLMADLVAPALAAGSPPPDAARTYGPEYVAGHWQRRSASRVTIADARGIVRASSVGEGVGAPIDDARRPGMRDALSGRGNATAWRSPNFAYEDTLYANAPAWHEGRITGVVRVAQTLTAIQQRVARLRSTLLLVVALYAAVIVALTLVFARTIVRPVERLQADAHRIASGDLSHRVAVGGPAEISELAATLNRMTSRLELLEGLRRRYVSDVSHELRTPLTAIRSMAETILQYGDGDPGLRERYLPRILTQTDRLARMVTQLLDLAHIESGNYVPSLAPLALGELLDEVALTHAARAAELGVAVETSVSDPRLAVRGDRDRLVQVFMNLVDNALRYTPRGGSVRLDAVAARGRVEVTVADTGRGVPAEHLPHLFERFYRVETARSPQAGGTGLGLAIVRQIVEAHGGHIRVDSAPGGGTTFTIELPGAEPAPLAPPEPRPASEEGAP
ncbi:MAG: integral rane sensor signal transduction histidine kinase [Myxococcaceae bacterium]|nr:integral rane sensor signal transduction histidine kinase [Myxococcaceae bacterium]